MGVDELARRIDDFRVGAESVRAEPLALFDGRRGDCVEEIDCQLIQPHRVAGETAAREAQAQVRESVRSWCNDRQPLECLRETIWRGVGEIQREADVGLDLRHVRITINIPRTTEECSAGAEGGFMATKAKPEPSTLDDVDLKAARGFLFGITERRAMWVVELD